MPPLIYDAQNLKLKYDGKEDEIIKLVEAGNVTFPSNSSLIQGASSLFGLRTDMQFWQAKAATCSFTKEEHIEECVVTWRQTADYI